MTNATDPRPTNYTEAAELLGDRDALKIGHNTWLERLSEYQIGVRFHQTIIVRFDVGNEHQGGITKLDSGGYRTATTKERINRYLPVGCGIYQKAYEWFLQSPTCTREFEDGMILSSDLIPQTAEQVQG